MSVNGRPGDGARRTGARSIAPPRRVPAEATKLRKTAAREKLWAVHPACSGAMLHAPALTCRIRHLGNLKI